MNQDRQDQQGHKGQQDRKVNQDRQDQQDYKVQQDCKVLQVRKVNKVLLD
ncbi:hypothetical protein [Acinetobacter tianfuensis]|nr:hypothetical protein [Acinetobacter tianfuensis]